MRWRVLPMLLSGAVVLACEDPASPPPPPNRAPTLDSLIIDPERAASGHPVEVAAYARDPDGDALTYDYQPDGGYIMGSGARVTWHPPENVGPHGMTVRVRDGRGAQASGRAGILVIAPTLLAGEIWALDGENTLWGTKILIYRTYDDFLEWRPAQPPAVVYSQSHFGAAFTFEVIAPGEYWIDAWQDYNHSGRLDAGDRYGVAGHGEPIDVREAQTTDIGQIQLYLSHAPLFDESNAGGVDEVAQARKFTVLRSP